ncbi:MAG: cell division protein FtsL [Treponemataceae bacterium]|nr:cell division protein FtsL [Treponemataceae bacterium]
MKEKGLRIFKTLGVYTLALVIPALLVLATVQSREYVKIESEVAALEQKQNELIESNKNFVTNISVLASSERIENYAVEELGMRKADSSEIVRVAIEGKR